MESQSETRPLNQNSEEGELCLVVTLPSGVAIHPLTGRTRFSIGRSRQCDIVVKHESISRRHLELQTSTPMRVIDAGTINGTQLGNERIPPGRARVVRVGDSLRVGQATLVVQRIASVSSVVSTSARIHGEGLLQQSVAETERKLIMNTLSECGGNQSRAARILGISRGTLRTRMKAYGLPLPRSADSDG